MSRRFGPLMVFAGVAALLALVPDRPAAGCAIAPPKDGSVGVAEEVAAIVYDDLTGIEHFVRKATFQTTSADFGFLVPTPTVPELVEASPAVFDALAKMTEPKVEVRRIETTDFGCAGPKAGAQFANVKALADGPPTAAAPGGVRVAQQVQVAGYEAVTLKADDPKQLTAWLGKNGYVSRPSLTEWFEHYTKAKWVITAFKLGEGAQAEGNGQFRVDNRLVRMSFKTDRAIYPYREPADAAAQAGPTADRLLRV